MGKIPLARAAAPGRSEPRSQVLPGMDICGLRQIPKEEGCDRIGVTSSGQEKSLNSSHLSQKLWCLSSQSQEASAPGVCAGGLLVLPTPWGKSEGCRIPPFLSAGINCLGNAVSDSPVLPVSAGKGQSEPGWHKDSCRCWSGTGAVPPWSRFRGRPCRSSLVPAVPETERALSKGIFATLPGTWQQPREQPGARRTRTHSHSGLTVPCSQSSAHIHRSKSSI
ncbi:uncharacterized protein [Chamaea fasciata]|uniref:uncharacterized protein n=1 Tax=Chamaea fasciata TaxID=190680 RepID=UPI003369F1A0